MTCHVFNIDDAAKYGVDAAIILHNLRFWLDHNKANNTFIYDGYVWTYNSARAMSDLFPYWTSNKIQKLMKKLESDGVVITGNYNKAGYDKTKWYTLPEYSLQPNGLSDSAKPLNSSGQKAEPIQDVIENIIEDVIDTGIFHSEKRISVKNLCKTDFIMCHEASRVLSFHGNEVVSDMFTLEEWIACEHAMRSVDFFDFEFFIWWIDTRSHSMRKKPSLPNILADKRGIEFARFYETTFMQEWD